MRTSPDGCDLDGRPGARVGDGAWARLRRPGQAQQRGSRRAAARRPARTRGAPWVAPAILTHPAPSRATSGVTPTGHALTTRHQQVATDRAGNCDASW